MYLCHLIKHTLYIYIYIYIYIYTLVLGSKNDASIKRKINVEIYVWSRNTLRLH